MSMFLIVLGALLGYLAIGFTYARSQSVRIYKEAGKAWRPESRFFTEQVRVMLALHTALWPVFMIGHSISKFMMAPVTARRDHVTTLRTDAKYWDDVARDEIDGEKKAMAEELARSLREQAKGLEL